MEANKPIDDGAPVDMSQVHLGAQYTSEDMYRDMGLGSKFSVERGGIVYTDTVESVRYSSGLPAVYRRLNRWQRIVRRLTPPRWRKSLLVREAEASSVTINGENSNPMGKTLAQLQEMQPAFGRLPD